MKFLWLNALKNTSLILNVSLLLLLVSVTHINCSKRDLPEVYEGDNGTRSAAKKAGIELPEIYQGERGARRMELDFERAVQQVNDFEKVKQLVEAGVNVNFKVAAYYPPLIEAIRHGNLDMVKLLLDSGADIHVLTHNELWSPLHFAADLRENININMIKLLIEKGADINVRNKSGHTPLDYFIFTCSLPKSFVVTCPKCPINFKEVVQLLIDSNADISAVDTKEHFARAYRKTEIIEISNMIENEIKRRAETKKQLDVHLPPVLADIVESYSYIK